MKLTSGLMLYRKQNKGVEVFLVHPGSPLWANKDEGVWSIPKGVLDQDENPRSACIREFKEETGYDLNLNHEDLIELGLVNLYSGKNMICYAFEKDIGDIKVESNLFDLEWPPRSGNIQKFPEADKGMYFDMQTARLKLNQKQSVFLEKLDLYLKNPELPRD